jgi:hypothetical protein
MDPNFEPLRTKGLNGHDPAKVPKFQYTAWWYSIDQKFHADVEKTHGPNFEPLRSIGFNDQDAAKVLKFKYRHDGALSIRNFALNQAQLIISYTCQLTANQKMCSLLPWYTEFPIYLYFERWDSMKKFHIHTFLCLALVDKHRIEYKKFN